MTYNHLLQWIDANQFAFWWLMAASVFMFLATLIVIPVLVVRIPADYFADNRRHRTPWGRQHPLLRGVLVTCKNLLGVTFILAGSAMLVLPGQGILTILIGSMMLDIPGKYRFERWLVQKPVVWRSMTWLRMKAGRDPLILGHHDSV